MFLCEQVSQPFPVGLVASALNRKLGLLRDLCFNDAEYGDAAQVPRRLQRFVSDPLNRELIRGGKHLHLDSIKPGTDRHSRITVTYRCSGEPGLATVDFLLFPPSARAKAREGDPDAETTGPRRGGTAKVARKKKAKPKMWE